MIKMTGMIEKIIKDLRSGRNIELYVNILVATVITILGLFNVVSSGIVSTATLTVLALVSFGLLQDRNQKEVPFIVHSDNNDNLDFICDYISKNNTKHAKLIQYSGDMARSVIDKLLEKGARVDLLLQHPENALNKVQLQKMAAFQVRVRNDYRNGQNLIIKYYKEPASMRGIRIDKNFLSVGWYTYRIKSDQEVQPWIYGHNNTTINIRLDQSNASDLAHNFDEVFQALWINAIAHDDSIETTISRRLRSSK